MKKKIDTIYFLFLTTAVSVVSFLSSFVTPETSFLHWILDLLSHWQLFYLFICIVLFFFCFKKHIQASMTCLVSIALVSFNPFFQIPKKQEKNLTFKILSSNVLFTTKDINYIEKIVQKEQPDLIYLMEINFQHIQELNYLSQKNNYFLISNPQNSPFGYAILSKKQLSINKVSMPENFIYFNEDNICGALVHLMPPISPEAKTMRDNTFNNMFAHIKNCNKKFSFIAGDFNASPWSYPLQKLKSEGYFSGSHIQPTWPTFFSGLMGIPIDHVVIDKEHTFKRYEIIRPENNSDHYTIIAEIN